MFKILASDFDGVICDGLLEYFESSRLTYNQIWTAGQLGDRSLSAQFFNLRPVIETGWEMPVLLRALFLDIAPREILANWHEICQQIMLSEGLTPQIIAAKLDLVRENWIDTDSVSWLALHRFYPNVIPALKQTIERGIKMYIISTKEGRFIKQLLQQQGIELPDTQIIGKERRQPKHETLRQIIAQEGVKPTEVRFIEDRLEALELASRQGDLQGMELCLASWGYNTEETRKSLEDNPDIYLLSLDEFVANLN